MQSRIAVEAIIEHSNVITFAGTCDLALWCKLLRDKGWTGPRIARALGRSEGYVNNLIRVVDRASPRVMMIPPMKKKLRRRARPGGRHVAA